MKNLIEMPSKAEMQSVFPQEEIGDTPREVFTFLEGKMRSFREYADIGVEDNGELLVQVTASKLLVAQQIGEDMRPYTGDRVFVREQVLDRLRVAGSLLGDIASGLQLQVVYGYRALTIQEKLFNQIRAQLIAEGFNGKDEDLLEAVHRMIAIPAVSGHPTAGAVDLQLLHKGEPLDMGTQIWDFRENSYTFSPFISKRAWKNRMLLRAVMGEAGFVPFDGEWWHFSFGDKEWAVAANEQFAIYKQIEFNANLI